MLFIIIKYNEKKAYFNTLYLLTKKVVIFVHTIKEVYT